MQKEEVLLNKVKEIIESELGWGESKNWVNQDFVALAKKMNEKTGNSISPVTLKRVWRKVNYDGLPQTYTLNTLARFVDYESWRDFTVKNGADTGHVLPRPETGPKKDAKPSSNRQIVIFCLLALAGISFGTFQFVKKPKVKSSDFAFSSHTTLNAGIPNTVVFNIDARSAREDSVIIQQSWDSRLRRSISKNDRQATMIYYFPGFFNPKLIADGKIVKEHDLLIKSEGWVTALLHKDIPVYFKKEDVMRNGKMFLPAAKIISQNIPMVPVPPVLSFLNVQDFGELYADDFDFETSVKNDYRSESSVCQATNIYLLCKGTAINIPLCAKGCESALNFYFTSHVVSGKKQDLSAFGVDFSSFVKVRIQSRNGKAKVFINDKLAYIVPNGISRSKIIGIDIAFQGTGSVNYVRLQNQKVKFNDEF